MNFDRIVEETSLKLAEAQRAAEKARREQQERQQRQARSEQAYKAYIEALTDDAIRLSRKTPKLIDEYVRIQTEPDYARAKVALRVLSHPLTGVLRTAGAYSFRGSDYSSLKDLRKAVEAHIGHWFDDRTFDGLLYAVSTADLSDPQELAISAMEALRPEPERPELEPEHNLRLAQVLGLDPMTVDWVGG